ncbi:MAG: MATE family efflux transporter [bacterium]|nr:MATE family efflux transporter [bacterium]
MAQEKTGNVKAAGSGPRMVEGAVGKLLFRLTLPMVFGIMSMFVFNLVDTFFVSKLGTLHLAAMSFTFPVVWVIGSIALGLGVGGSAVISRAIGEGDHHKVQRLTTDSLVLSMVIVFFFIFLGLVTIEPLFSLLGAGPEIIPLIKEYMLIWYPGVIFLVIPMVGNSAIRATGDTKTPSIIMLCSVVSNLVLDPLLIFGIGPFPRWELQGAAVATVIARAITLVLSLWVLHKREKMLTFVRPTLKEGILSWKKILYVGLPAAGTNLIMPVSLGVITRLVSTYGTSAVAAFGVATRVEGFALTVNMAMGSVLTPFVGQNLGAGKLGRVKLAVKYSRWFSMCWGGLAFAVLLFFAPEIAGVFSKKPEVISYIITYLHMVSFSYGFMGILMITGAIFNGMNQPMPSATLSLLRMVLLYVPFAYIGSYFWQLPGIFGAALVSNITGGIAAYIWLNLRLKKL